MTASHTIRQRPALCRGLSSLEALVAFTLLASVLAMSTPLIVAHGKLLKAQRNYRLALDELSNQLDRLTSLSAQDLDPALEDLAPSPFTAELLPGAALNSSLEEGDFGRRLTLEISWDEPNRSSAPVRLSAWLPPAANAQEVTP